MMPKGLFSQILLLALAIGIVIFYIRPQFAYIADTQDLIAVYQEERKKVVTVNSRLHDLVENMNSVSADSRGRLFDYLPDTVDPIVVQSDIKGMVEASGANYEGVIYQDTSQRSSGSSEDEGGFSDTTKPYLFTVQVEGTYDQLKELLSIMERNSYPLEVRTLTLSPLEGGFISFDLSVATYGLENDEMDNEFEF